MERLDKKTLERTFPMRWCHPLDHLKCVWNENAWGDGEWPGGQMAVQAVIPCGSWPGWVCWSWTCRWIFSLSSCTGCACCSSICKWNVFCVRLLKLSSVCLHVAWLMTPTPSVPAKGSRDGSAFQMASVDTARVKYLFWPDTSGCVFIYSTDSREEEPWAGHWMLKCSSAFVV